MTEKTLSDSIAVQVITLQMLCYSDRLMPVGVDAVLFVVDMRASEAQLLESLKHDCDLYKTKLLRVSAARETCLNLAIPTDKTTANSIIAKIALRLKSVRLVIIFCRVHDFSSHRLSVVVASAARLANATVIGLLTPDISSKMHRTDVQASFAGSADALVILPPSPQPALLRALTDAYALATMADRRGTRRLNALVAGDLLDVRRIFTGRSNPCIGTGSASGPDRAARAAVLAMTDLGAPPLSGGDGMLLLISGEPSMRLTEINDVVRAIRASTSGEVEMAFGVYYGAQFGSAIRVTVVTSSET